MKKLTILPIVIAFIFSQCSSQDDADALFSDTEKAIIKTLIYADPADDPTSSYDQNSAAATLGQQFFWDFRFSGGIVVTGNRSTADGTIIVSGAANDYTVGQSRKINCVTCHNPN